MRLSRFEKRILYDAIREYNQNKSKLIEITDFGKRIYKASDEIEKKLYNNLFVEEVKRG